MYQRKSSFREKQNRIAGGKMLAAMLEAAEEIQFAAKPGKAFDLLVCLRYLLSRAGLIAVCGLVCVMAALIFYQIVPPKYEATAKLYLLENTGSGIELAALQKGTLLVPDYKEVFQTWQVHEAVRTDLGLDISYHELQEMLTVQVPSGSRLLYITIRHKDPLFAAELANSYAQAGYEFIVSALQGMEPDMFSSAIIPSHVSGLGIAARLIIVFALGVLLAGCGCVGFFYLDERIVTPDQLAMAAEAPALASLPRRNGQAMTVEEKERACLLASQLIARKAGCVLVTACQSGSGASFVCDDLLQAGEALHHQTLWIRVEHKPFWKHEDGQQLGDYLRESCAWEKMIQPYEGGSLLAVCGTEDELPSQLFHPRMRELMETLKERYDLILVDVPPLDQRADGSAFFPFCDSVILVGEFGRSRFSEVSAYAALLRDNGCRLMGCVLNGVGGSMPKAAFWFHRGRKGAAA